MGLILDINPSGMTLHQLRARTEAICFGRKRIARPTSDDLAHSLVRSPSTPTQTKANILADMLSRQKRKPQRGIEGSEDVGGGGL